MNNIQRRRIVCALAVAPFSMPALQAAAQGVAKMPSLHTGRLLLTSNLKTPPVGATPAVDIVGDLPHKSGFTINSWFVIGHFESRGHTLNYLVHLLAISIKGVIVAVDSAVSITDETTGWYGVQHNVYPIFRASVSSDQMLIKTPNSEVSGTLDHMRVRAQIKNASIDVNLIATGYPLYNKGTGRFDLLGMDVHQYSIPTLQTVGHVIIDGRKFPAAGESWFDRQWQSQPLGPPKGRWTWMDLNLSNGWRISLWDAVAEDGKLLAWVTMIDGDGTHTVIDMVPLIEDASDYWLSTLTRCRYPTRWRVLVPGLDMQLEVVAMPQEQEVNGLSARYEGAASVTGWVRGGKVSGYTYVEMVGDWSA